MTSVSKITQHSINVNKSNSSHFVKHAVFVRQLIQSLAIINICQDGTILLSACTCEIAKNNMHVDVCAV